MKFSLHDFIREGLTLFRLAWPIVVGQVGQMLFGTIDVAMVGRVSTVDLAAISFANSIYVVFLVFGLGISNATSPLVSRALGRNDLASAGRVLKYSLRVNLILGISLTLLAFISMLFFDQMGQLPEVTQKSKLFFTLICFTFVPAFLYQCLKQALECLGHPKIPMITIAVGLLFNVVANWIFIFGFGPIQPMGVAGAAVGTIVSRCVMVGILFIFMRKAQRLHEFRNHQQFAVVKKMDWHVVKELLALGIPSGFVVLFEVGAFASAAFMMGWLGSLELAAHQVAISMASISFMFPMGISHAASIRVGFESGRNDKNAVRVSGLTALISAAIFMTCVGVLFAAGNAIFPRIFTNDSAVVVIASRLLIVAALFQVFDGIQVVCIGILRALKDIRWPFAITFSAYWVIALPLGYLLGFTFKFGPLGIWLGLFIGLFVAALLLSFRFIRLTGSR